MAVMILSVLDVPPVLVLTILFVSDTWVLKRHLGDIVAWSLLKSDVIIEEETQELLFLVLAYITEVDNRLTRHLTNTFILLFAKK